MTLLADARRARGWSQAKAIKALEQEAAARRLPVASTASLKTMLSRWENGSPCDAHYQQLWQWVYRLSAGQLGFARHGLSPGTSVGTRAFPTASIGSDVLDLLRTTLDKFTAIDSTNGSSLILPLLETNLAMIEDLCHRARGSVRTDLLTTGLRFFEFAGWAYQDAGDLPSAARWTHRAHDCAEELGDDDLSAYVLMRRSAIATDAGSVGQAVGLANAAIRASRNTTPGIHALGLRQKAHAHALAGERDETARAIDGARGVVEHVNIENEPELTGYCTPSYIEMESAHCWTVLGESDVAVEIYARSLENWPDAQHRDRGLCTARLASTYAELGDIDKATDLGTVAAQLVSAAPSARTIGTLRKTAIQLASHKRHESVRQFQNEIKDLV